MKMQETTHIKRRFTISSLIVGIFIVCLLCTTLLNTTARAFDANIEIDNGESVRAYIGSSREYSENMEDTQANYRILRHKHITNLCKQRSSDVFSAVVVFDDFYSVEDTKEILSHEGISLNKVFMWTPGETGRLMLVLNDGDIDKALKTFIEEKKSSDDISETAMNDLERFIKGDYGIFSAVVTGKTENLNDLIKQKHIEFVDVIHHSEGEAYAKERGTSVSYLLLPYKPDGAY